MADRTSILIVADTANEMGQAILRGAMQYVHTRRTGWQVLKLGLHPRPNMADFVKEYPFQGAIAHLSSPRMIAMYEALGVPVVNTSNVVVDSPFPRVCSDDVAAGAMVGRYLVDNGFTSAIYCGNAVCAYSDQRLAGIRQALGHDSVKVIDAEQRRGDVDPLEQLLRSVEPPVALISAEQADLCSVAMRCGLSVPEQAFVLGFNNDSMICDLHQPTLSSVELPFEEIGARAAIVLEKLLNGEAVDDREIRLPPMGVVERQSTSVSAIPDAEVRRALALIREADGHITVAALADALPVTQRSLEMRFRELMGHTPVEHIIRYRAERARRLLMQTNMSVTQIAVTCGFSGATHMGVVFRRLWDVTPTMVRRHVAR